MKIINIVVTVACAVSSLSLWLVFGKQLPPQVPLFYSRPWGDSQLAQPAWLLIIPSIAVVVGFVMGWASEKTRAEIPLSIMLLATSIAAQIVLTLGLVRIFLIVV